MRVTSRAAFSWRARFRAMAHQALASILLRTAAIAVCAACLACPSAQAVNIGSLQTFNTLPSSNEFSTFSIPGTGGTITTVTDFDSAVQTNAILANFTNGLNQTTGNPIGNLGLARWSSTGLYIGTRPTGNDGTLLLCRVTNS